MREQNRDPDRMESSHLTDAVFKTVVIKMLNDLLGSVDKFSENINKGRKKNIKTEMEIVKGNQFEKKNILSEMRSILNGTNKGINKTNKEKD